MDRGRTGSLVREEVAPPPVATVQVLLPLLDVLTDTRPAFFGLCLDAGQQVLRAMMEENRERLCGPKHVPNPQRRAQRGGSTRGEVTLGGRRILVPWLRKALRDTCGATALVQRCQVHKRRNVLEHLPETMRPRVRRVLDEAYGLEDAALAKRRLEQLAAGLDATHPGATASLREGLDEVLTLQRLRKEVA